MIFLYYDRSKRTLVLHPEKVNDKTLELLESNNTLESLMVRIDQYKRIYKCDVVNYVDQKVDGSLIYRIKNKGVRKKLSPETIEKIRAKSYGENNGRYGVSDPPHIRESKSRKLKEYYSIHVHGKKGYKDSDETRRMKSVNNINKGNWYWAYDPLTNVHKRIPNDQPMPDGYKKGRNPAYTSIFAAKKYTKNQTQT